MNPRVALLVNIPTPYRIPFYKELSHYCNLLVILDSYIEPNRKWNLPDKELEFPHTVAKGFHISYKRKRPDISIDEERYLHIGYGIFPILHRFKPHVVISGEMGLRTLQAAGYTALTHTPLIVRWEGTPHTEGWVTRKKSTVRRFIVRRTRRFWSNGRESSALLLDYGASPDTIDEGMTGVDTRFFAQEVRDELPQREHIRSKLQLEGTVLLFVGQLIERKGVREYLDALGKLYDSGLRGWSAVFVGSGPLEGEIRSWQSKRPEVPLFISGFVQQDELPSFYAAADVFVLPTLDDNWSLSSLEAAAAGLPQLFSVYNGSTSDLLYDERTGRAVDPLKVRQFASALSDYVQNPPPRVPDEVVQQLVEYYSPKQLATRAWKSIEKTLR